MRQRWVHLLFLHWSVPAEDLQALLPPGLELDTFENRAYVGLVPFAMRGVRPWWSPAVPGLSSFPEVNVRTYVHRRGCDPGVWFFSLDAANRVAVALARSLFHLPYYYAGLFLEREATAHPDPDRPILYAGVRRRPDPRPASYLIRAHPTGAVRPARPDTLEHFLVERYVLYALANDRLYQGRVHHHPYPLQGAEILALDECLLATAGIRRPDSAPIGHYAAGVDVKVYALRRST